MFNENDVWNKVKGYDECPEAVTGDVLGFERDYHLVTIDIGSPKQIKFGRDCRYKCLSTILPFIIELTVHETEPRRKLIFNEVDRLRHLRSSIEWIGLKEQCSFGRSRIGAKFIEYVLGTPDRVEAAARLVEQREREEEAYRAKCKQDGLKAVLHRRQNAEARLFNTEHTLLPIQGSSHSQEAFANRSRYLLLVVREITVHDRSNLDAGFWISEYLKMSKSDSE